MQELLVSSMDSLLSKMNNFKVADDMFGMNYKAPLIGSIGYLVVIYGLKHFIQLTSGKSVDPKHKSGRLVHFLTQVHNIFMVALSFSMFIGVIYAAYTRVFHSEANGSIFRGLICPKDAPEGQESTALDGPIGFWIYIFHLSKYYELLDTVLLVVKRKPLIFLHVYHHLVMVSATWFMLSDRWLVGAWWCVLVNSLVHTFMYYYYYIAANGKTVSWKSLMTAGQIIQLWSGFLLVVYWIYVKNTHQCTQGYYAGMYSHFTNCVLIYQFCAFYVRKYLTGETNSVAGKKPQQQQEEEVLSKKQN